MKFIDIIILAMIAAFLVFRLRNVLGKRTGMSGLRKTPTGTVKTLPMRGPRPMMTGTLSRCPGKQSLMMISLTTLRRVMV